MPNRNYIPKLKTPLYGPSKFKLFETDKNKYPRSHGDKSDPKYGGSELLAPRKKPNFFMRRLGAVALTVGLAAGVGAAAEKAGVPVVDGAKAVATAPGNLAGYVGDAVDSTLNRSLPPGGEPVVWEGGKLIDPTTRALIVLEDGGLIQGGPDGTQNGSEN